MMTRIVTLAIAGSLATGLMASRALPPAYGQSAAQVLCDRVAADPADPDKPKDIAGVAAIARGDVSIALKYCHEAAGQSRRALYELGRAYAANGQINDAVKAYRKAADKGSTSAMVDLGVLLMTGNGVAKDEAKARALFERAAKAGNPRGSTNLVSLSGGAGAPGIDPGDQRRMLAQAAAENSADAEYELGMMYANGVGGPQDDVAARALFAKAAAQNQPWALLWMGAFAEQGRGGPKDKDAAKQYYQRVTKLGDAQAATQAEAGIKRIDCPYLLRDKAGNVVTHLCF
jgi:uncharacterized protein